jgi:hypothetical protein
VVRSSIVCQILGIVALVLQQFGYYPCQTDFGKPLEPVERFVMCWLRPVADVDVSSSAALCTAVFGVPIPRVITLGALVGGHPIIPRLSIPFIV